MHDDDQNPFTEKLREVLAERYTSITFDELCEIAGAVSREDQLHCHCAMAVLGWDPRRVDNRIGYGPGRRAK